MKVDDVINCLKNSWILPLKRSSDILVIGYDPIFMDVLLSYVDSLYCFNLDTSVQHNKVHFLHGDLDHALKLKENWDCIVFAASMPAKQLEEVSFEQLKEFKHAREDEKRLYKEVHEKLGDLSQIKYSDQDLEDFIQQINSNQKEFAINFFNQLLKNKQITERQFERYSKNFSVFEKNKVIEWRVESCLECLKNHIVPKGCFIGFIDQDYSFYNQPLFLEEVMTSSEYSFIEMSCSKDLDGYFKKHHLAIPKCFLIKKS